MAVRQEVLQWPYHMMAVREASTARRPCGRGQVSTLDALPHGHRAVEGYFCKFHVKTVILEITG